MIPMLTPTLGLLTLRRVCEAKAEYKEAIRIDPDDAIAHTDLIIAISLSELGRATSVSDGWLGVDPGRHT